MAQKLLCSWLLFLERCVMNRILYTLVFAIGFAVALPAQAQTYAFAGPSTPASLVLTFDDGTATAITAETQGWWSPTETNFNGNTNIVAGTLFGVQWNDFFLFDLAGHTGTLLTARLTLNTGIVAGTPRFGLWDVSTALADLQNLDAAPSAAIYADLGSGIAYSAPTPILGGHTDIDLALDGAAIAAIQGALGGRFAIGGSVATDVPEPATILVLLPAVAAAGYLRRQTSNRSALS